MQDKKQNNQLINLCLIWASLRKVSVSLPCNTPVGLDLEDGGIICVVELDLRVS